MYYSVLFALTVFMMYRDAKMYYVTERYISVLRGKATFKEYALLGLTVVFYIMVLSVSVTPALILFSFYRLLFGLAVFKLFRDVKRYLGSYREGVIVQGTVLTKEYITIGLTLLFYVMVISVTVVPALVLL